MLTDPLDLDAFVDDSLSGRPTRSTATARYGKARRVAANPAAITGRDAVCKRR